MAYVLLRHCRGSGRAPYTSMIHWPIFHWKNGSLDVLLPYLKTALQKVSHQSRMTVERRAEEANWFRKIGTESLQSGMVCYHFNLLQHLHSVSWNSALQCESSPDRMRDFFVLSYQLCPSDRTLLMGQKTCLLMAAAASLELCRKSPHSAQTEQLTQALEYIQTCWEVWKTLKASGTLSSFLPELQPGS
ncbi:Testis-expressed sequence 11 protein [Liparis tanakae]|uniref:Testis-expressed sequence 11 protein n=1 Tax=Liparis tanakae TaxID=230148 RepID=A0A4Z2EAJ4_9TELE|nr:Testis-expressed sequence 11 protein [Liparis tanakae]